MFTTADLTSANAASDAMVTPYPTSKPVLKVGNSELIAPPLSELLRLAKRDHREAGNEHGGDHCPKAAQCFDRCCAESRLGEARIPGRNQLLREQVVCADDHYDGYEGDPEWWHSARIHLRRFVAMPRSVSFVGEHFLPAPEPQ